MPAVEAGEQGEKAEPSGGSPALLLWVLSVLPPLALALLRPSLPMRPRPPTERRLRLEELVRDHDDEGASGAGVEGARRTELVALACQPLLVAGPDEDDEDRGEAVKLPSEKERSSEMDMGLAAVQGHSLSSVPSVAAAAARGDVARVATCFSCFCHRLSSMLLP